MDGIRNVAASPLVIFTRVDNDHWLARVELLLVVAEILFLDAGFFFFYKLEKSLGMIRHDLPRSLFAVQQIKFSTVDGPPCSESLHVAPVGAYLCFRDNWHAELVHPFHHFLYQLSNAGNFLFRSLEQKLVMHLQNHL